MARRMEDNVPILNINADSPQVSRKHSTIQILISQIAHRPASLVVHDDQRASAFGRSSHGLVHADANIVPVTSGHAVHRFRYMVWDGARDGVEMTKLLEMRGTGDAVAVEVTRSPCGVGWAGLKGLMELSK